MQFSIIEVLAGIAPYSARLFAWFETQDVRRLLKGQWLYIIVWLLLLGWGAYEIMTHN